MGYTEEYRREAADLAIASGRPTTEVARGLGTNHKAFGNWVAGRRRELAGGVRAAGLVDTPESRGHRRRIREPGLGNGFLKKAAASFAKARA
jgi:transposase-like protein